MMFTQHPRPPMFERPSENSTLADISIVEITPVNRNGEALHDLNRTQKWTRIFSESTTVLWAAWSRGSVHVVTSTLGQKSSEELVQSLMEQLPKAMRTEIDFSVVSDPADWDFTLRSAERAARAALKADGGHQCAGAAYCICGYEGCVYPYSEAARRGERGGIVGAGAGDAR